MPGLPSYRLGALVDALQLRSPDAQQFHRSVADVNHTIAIWQSLHARFAEHTGLAVPPVTALCTLMRKPKTQVPKYLATLRTGAAITARPGGSHRGNAASGSPGG